MARKRIRSRQEQLRGQTRRQAELGQARVEARREADRLGLPKNGVGAKLLRQNAEARVSRREVERLLRQSGRPGRRR